MARPSMRASRCKDSQKCLADSNGCLSAEDKLWRTATERLKMTQARVVYQQVNDPVGQFLRSSQDIVGLSKIFRLNRGYRNERMIVYIAAKPGSG